MSRRTELRSIGSGLLHSFCSRNSEIDRLWSIGKLYSYAIGASSRAIRINLLNGEVSSLPGLLSRITLPLNIFPLTSKYEGMLRRIMAQRAIPDEWLSKAEINIDFESARAEPRYPKIGIDATPFFCTLELTDDLGKTHELSTSGWCWPHNPWKEFASARVPN